MPVSKEKKQEIITELTDLFKNSKSVVFTDYQGISVKDVQTLRKNLLDNDSQFKVAKKTLVKLAAKEAGFNEIPEEALVGQVGVAFSKSDEIAAAKTLYDFSKTNETVKLLSAIMEGKTLTQAETIELAKIPSRDELLAKMVGSMKSPISGFHGVLYSLLRTFVGVVDAYKDSLPAEEAPKEEAPAPAPAEEPKAEEAPAPEGDVPAEAKAEEAPKEEPKAEEKAEEEAKPEGDVPKEEPGAKEDVVKEEAETPTEGEEAQAKEDPSPEAPDPDNKQT